MYQMPFLPQSINPVVDQDFSNSLTPPPDTAPERLSTCKHMSSLLRMTIRAHCWSYGCHPIGPDYFGMETVAIALKPRSTMALSHFPYPSRMSHGNTLGKGQACRECRKLKTVSDLLITRVSGISHYSAPPQTVRFDTPLGS